MRPTHRALSTQPPPMTPLLTTVLVVDDDECLRRAVVEWLGDRGCVVFTADSCRSGLDQTLLRQPDVVLLDLGLPDGSGLQLIHALRDRGMDLPVVILSVLKDPLEAFDAARLGAIGLIQKPSPPDQIAAVVHRAAREGGGLLQKVLRRLRTGLDASGRRSLRGWLVDASGDHVGDLIGFRHTCASLRLVGDDADAVDLVAVQNALEAAQRVRATLPEATLGLLRAFSQTWTALASDVALPRPSERYRRSELRALTGLDYPAWVRLERLWQSVQLLLTSDEHVRQIAIQLGFAHGGQLCRDIRDLTGLSPRRFRAVSNQPRLICQ